MADVKTSIGQAINIEPIAKAKRPRIKAPGYLSTTVTPTVKKQDETVETVAAPIQVKNEQSKKQKNNGKKFVKNDRPKVSKEERYEKSVEMLNSVIARDGGKFVTFDDVHYLLVAGVEHNKHLYFMVMDKNRDFDFIPMKSTFKISRGVDVSMGIVNFLLERQRNDLVETIETYLKNNDEYKVIAQGIKSFKRTNKNTGKKNFKKDKK